MKRPAAKLEPDIGLLDLRSKLRSHRESRELLERRDRLLFVLNGQFDALSNLTSDFGHREDDIEVVAGGPRHHRLPSWR